MPRGLASPAHYLQSKMPPPVPKSEFIGTTLELIGYGQCHSRPPIRESANKVIGAYLVIFVECMRVLRVKYMRGTSTIYLWGVALAIYCLCTIVSGHNGRLLHDRC